MELRERLRNRLLLFLIAIFMFGCYPKSEDNLPLVNVENVNSFAKSGIFYVEDTIFSGTMYGLFPDTKDTAFVQSYLEGKEHGTWMQFYPNGELKEVRHFRHGQKQGDYTGWWMGGQKRLSYHFVDGEYQGTCCEWNQSGILIKKMTYQQGYEVGPQQMWYGDGKIKANYVMKDGRRFGLLGTKNCNNVSDSIFSN